MEEAQHPDPSTVTAALMRLSTAIMRTTLLCEAPPTKEFAAPSEPVGSPGSASIQALTKWMRLMQQCLSAVSPLLHARTCESPRMLAVDPSDPSKGAWVLWPTHWPQAVSTVLLWSLAAWKQCAEGEPGANSSTVERLRAQWQHKTDELKRRLPSGYNPANLLAAAKELDVPVRWVDGDVVQLGQGAKVRWWRSTLTDETPSLGVTLARDKTRTNRLLRAAAIPVPRHIEVHTQEAALQAAQSIGWPVVVKPADQDKGNGARANLRSVQEVKLACEHAFSFSKRLLVEQHLEGREYRLTVAKGKLLWAHERLPATLVGDGEHSLQALIDAENLHRQHALIHNPNGWNPITVDEELQTYLKETGWELTSIPAKGESVRLQRVPAATTGGGGQACMDGIHPDNRQLAERAARLLRLDIAGVDLIMPDITQSWTRVGGAITEVNAIPQISLQTNPRLMHLLLDRMMPTGGRIPLIVVLAANLPPQTLDAWREGFAAAGLCLGESSLQGMRVGSEWYVQGRTSAWEHMQALQLERCAEAMLLVSDGVEFLKIGLPFDRVDVLVVKDEHPRVLELLKPYSQEIIVDAAMTDSPSWIRATIGRLQTQLQVHRPA